MTRARLSVSTMFFANGFVFASWVPFIPGVKDRHQLNDAALGSVLLALALGAVVTLPLAGAWAARHGSRLPTTVAALGFCLALPLVLLAPDRIMLVAALILFGALNALLDVSMNAQAVQVERDAGKAIMSSFHGLFSLGGLLGAGAAGLALSAGVSPLHYTLGVSTCSLLAVGGMAGGLVPGERDRARAAQAVFVLPSGPVLGLGLLTFAGLMVEGAMADWTAVYLRDQLSATPAFSAMGFAAFSGCMAAGRFAGDFWVNRVGASRALWLSGLLAAFGMAGAVAAQSPWLAAAGFGLVGLGASNIIPILFSAAGRLDGGSPGRSLAAVATMGYLGFLAGPPLIGWIAELSGMRISFAVLALMCALIALRGSRLGRAAAVSSAA